MSVTRQPDSSEITAALQSLTGCRRALAGDNASEAAACLKRFRSSAAGHTVRQLESDLLELRLTVLQNAKAHQKEGGSLLDQADRLFTRHNNKQNEDAYLAGAAEIIRRYLGPEVALAWIETKCESTDTLTSGRGRALALYLKLLRHAGRLDEARSLANDFLSERPIQSPDRRLWEETIFTLRGQSPKERAGLLARIDQVANGLSARRRLELLNLASSSRILVASTEPVGGTTDDTLREQRLALDYHRQQATLNARQQYYAAAADHLNQARDISASLRGESVETLELDLQRFEMLLQAGSADPTDATWLEHLRAVAAEIGRTAYCEYRLANVWRKAGQMSLAQAQYAAINKSFPQDRWGIRAACQLAVADEEAGNLDSAYARYVSVANLAETKPSVAAFTLVGAFRCAVRSNDETLQTKLIDELRNFTATIPDLRLASFVVRRLRDDGLGELSDALLDQCLSRYQELKSSVTTHKYLELTHHFVRRLYAANRYSETLELINSIDAAYWNNAQIHWEHLAGCLHYGCLCWLALGDPKKAVDFATTTPTPLSTRPTQASHVDLAVARVYEQTSPWDMVQTIYNRIIGQTPFSRAAMKARVQLARRAWDLGNVDEAQQWATGVLMDGKVNRKDPDLAAAYWSAYSMAASRQGDGSAQEGIVVPDLPSEEAMKRQRWSGKLRQRAER